MERRLRCFPFYEVFDLLGYLQAKIEASDIRVRHLTEPEFTTAPSPHELDVLDDETARHEKRVAHLVASMETLERRHAELIECRHVLRETASFFSVNLVQIILKIERCRR